MEHEGGHGDPQAEGGDAKSSSSLEGSIAAPAPSRSVSLSEKDKPDVIDMVSGNLAPPGLELQPDSCCT